MGNQKKDVALSVLHYFDQFGSGSVQDLLFLGNHGGFSGAELWQFKFRKQKYLLRQWPADAVYRQSHLAWINSNAQALYGGGCEFIAVPLFNRKRQTLTRHLGGLWQVEPWMPGQADFWSSPSAEKLENAMQALARFHISAAEIHPPEMALAPAIENRLRRIEKLKRIDESSIRQSSIRRPTELKLELSKLATEVCRKFHILAPAVSLTLRRLATTRFKTGICLRDVWHDHILFDGADVSGIVDYGAMKIDSPAVDVSRLIGSLVGDDGDRWQQALQYFEQIRALSPEERNLITAADRSTTLIAGMNWIDWIYFENRDFGQIDQIKERIRRIIQRAEFLQESLGIRLLER